MNAGILHVTLKQLARIRLALTFVHVTKDILEMVSTVRVSKCINHFLSLIIMIIEMMKTPIVDQDMIWNLGLCSIFLFMCTLKAFLV
jgi:hypothetical protein